MWSTMCGASTFRTHPALVAQWACWSSLHHSLLNKCKCHCPLQWCWGGSECSPVSCCSPGLCWWSFWEVLHGPQPRCGARWCWRGGSCLQCSWRRQGLERSLSGQLKWPSHWVQLHETGNNEWYSRTGQERTGRLQSGNINSHQSNHPWNH